MFNQKKLIVSHAPFWHDGSGVPARNRQIVLALLPALFFGLVQFGPQAVAVTALAVGSAVCWELLFCMLAKRPVTIGDFHAILIGLLFAMLLPATTPWWVVLVGTFLAIILGKQIYGGIGAYPFHPAVVAVAILAISWPFHLDIDQALAHFSFSYPAAFPLGQLKAFGTDAVAAYQPCQMFLGQQTGSIGTTFGLGLVAGGIYLILRGIVRLEIVASFLVGLAVTAWLFHLADPAQYAGPAFHLVTGFTLIGAFFLATEDAVSPVNPIPMLLYGALGGVMTILIRNIGVYADGVLYAILVINLVSPLADKIRPRAIGRVA